MANGIPDITVVVRSMDRPHLARALRSIGAQQGDASAEVVVVAACGPSHRPVEPRVGRFECRLAKAGGPLDRPRAANLGLDHARGRLVAFLDDDDEYLQDHFEALAGELAAHPEADFVHAHSLAVDPSGTVLHEYGGPWVEWRCLTHGFFQLGAVLFRRELLERGVRFDESLEILEDMEFFLQCSRVATFRHLPRPVSRYYGMDGTSGAGVGSNEDRERVRRALAAIRAKWSGLAERIEAMPESRVARAQSLLKSSRFEEAVEVLEPMVRDGRRDVNVYNLSAVGCMHLGRFEEARAYLDAALQIVPNHPGLMANLQLLARLAGFEIPGF